MPRVQYCKSPLHMGHESCILGVVVALGNPRDEFFPASVCAAIDRKARENSRIVDNGVDRGSRKSVVGGGCREGARPRRVYLRIGRFNVGRVTLYPSRF